jgi:hypothetical protein
MKVAWKLAELNNVTCFCPIQALATTPGANPTIASYNASVVKIYTTTCSLVRFEIKENFFNFEKRSSLLQRSRGCCTFRSRTIGSEVFK